MSETIERPAAPPAKKDSTPLSQVARVADLFSNADFIGRVTKAVSGSVSTNLMLSALAGSFRRSPALAECSVMDVAGKALLLAQAGLPPDTITGASHLVPFKEKFWNPATKKLEERYVCQMVIGYHGLLDLAYRSGKVDFIIGRVAWPDEFATRAFDYQLGTDEFLHHKPGSKTHNLSAEAQANGTAEYPSHAYAIAHLTNGQTKPFEVWPMAKVLELRDTTAAYGFAKYVLNEARQKNSRLPAAYTKTPWVAFCEKMSAKTMVRQLCTWLPRSTNELAAMAALDEAQERRTIDLGPIIDSTDYVSAAADAAEMSGDAGAAFGYRADGEPDMPPEPPPEAPPEAAQPRRERAQRQTAPKAPETPKPPPAPPQTTTASAPPSSPSAQADVSPTAGANQGVTAQPSAPAFDQWLLDEQGDPVEHYTSAMAYAQALETLWNASANKDALLEQNADGRADAAKLDERAANVINSMTEEPDATVVVLKQGRDGPVWIDFIRDVRAEIAHLPAPMFLNFCAANMATIQSAPPSTLSLLVKHIVERSKALDIPPPAGLSNGLQAAASTNGAKPATPQEDKDRRQADNILDELARITDENALRLYSTRDAVKVPRARWLAEGKQALHDEITAAFNRRYTEITGKPVPAAP
jgi:recombination protein RecT